MLITLAEERQEAWKALCQRVKDQRLERSRFSSAESNTNKESDNGAQENDNPGGGVFNPRLGLAPVKQSGGSTRNCYKRAAV